MNQCGVFFFLFSFLSCAFLSSQAPVTNNNNNPDVNDLPIIDYNEQALQLIRFTTASGSTIDWQRAFEKVAPIAIFKVKEARRNAAEARRNAAEAKENSIDAGRYHFILLSRNKLIFHEDRYSKVPKEDNEFRKLIKQDERFTNIPEERISCKKHAKAWLWLLVKGDEKVLTQLHTLRNSLNNDADEFLWFVDHIQSFFEVFNDDVHSPPCSLLDPKHIDVNNLGSYMSFLNPDIKKVMKIFYESEGFKVDIGNVQDGNEQK
ncbi:uncharacterized protein LOC135843497 [Planococcus citri]|uniref:uncharacterized protein LOC135843497 n=1 Tax=Planococcus citri TaxID=170843 RepID=UPI0031F86EF7